MLITRLSFRVFYALFLIQSIHNQWRQKQIESGGGGGGRAWPIRNLDKQKKVYSSVNV